MADPLRIGIAGCGAIARQVHIPLLLRHRDANVAAIAEPDAHALAAVNADLPRARAFATLRDMLQNIDLDAVIVALPTDLHAAAACAVFEAGCDLFLEKPLSASATSGAAVVDAWRDSGRIGMMGFNGRFNPLYRRLRDVLRAGRAGHAVYARTVFATAPKPMPEWKRSRATGGGALLDLGAHHIDLMRFLFSREISAVHATLESRFTDDDSVLLELELEGGPRIHGFFSLSAAEHDQVEVYGDRARVSVSRFTSLDVDVIDNPGRGGGALGRLMRRAGRVRHLGAALRARRSPLRDPGYALALDAFLEAVRTRRLAPDAADIADGYACLAVIEAAERSAGTGQFEAIERAIDPARLRDSATQESSG